MSASATAGFHRRNRPRHTGRPEEQRHRASRQAVSTLQISDEGGGNRPWPVCPGSSKETQTRPPPGEGGRYCNAVDPAVRTQRFAFCTTNSGHGLSMYPNSIYFVPIDTLRPKYMLFGYMDP